MNPVGTLLALPVRGPIGALSWLARQVAEAAIKQMLDPARIEAALLDLERRLEAGEIDEVAFEAAEALLLEELAEMRAISAGADDADAESPDGDGADVPEPEVRPEPEPEVRPEPAPVAMEAGPWTAA